MTPADWLLVAADAAYPKALQPVQLQKVLFLLDRKLNASQKGCERIYAFEPYDYGPFDSAIYSDAGRLAAAGLMQLGKQWTYRTYALTPDGHARAQEIANVLPEAVRTYVKALVEWAQRLSFTQLVSAIYRDFPEMRANSVFKG